MSAVLADDELLISHTFDAPAELVFSLWAKPEHMKHWMGPDGYVCPHAEIDFRVGGEYRCMMKSPSNEENWFGGTYREIVPPPPPGFHLCLGCGAVQPGGNAGDDYLHGTERQDRSDVPSDAVLNR
jgi:hypothetical protein